METKQEGTSANEKMKALSDRALQLKEGINKLLSDFKAETGCEAQGKIRDGVADIFTLISIEKIL